MLPSACPFSPRRVLSTDVGLVVLGTDGEVQQLNIDGREVAVHRPYPLPIVGAGMLEGDLIAAWMDHELRVARLARLDLSETIDGVERAVVRQDTVLATHPIGHRWSHALDAEPVSMFVHGPNVAMALWPDGFYVIDGDGLERWRSTVPRGKDGRPRMIVNTTFDEGRWILTTRDGSRIAITETEVVELEPECTDDPVVLVAHGGGGRLVVSSNHVASWVKNGTMVLQATLSGPVGGACWDPCRSAWCIAGWRERVVLREDGFERWPSEDVNVDVANFSGSVVSLDNRGRWAEFPA